MRSALLAAIGVSLAAGCITETGLDDITDTVDEPEDTEDPVVVEGEPIADAGDDQSVSPLTTIILSGLDSTDPGGNVPLAYKWSLVGQPSGSTALLNNDSSPQPTFFADLAGEYLVELTVQNSLGVWDSSPDQVLITALPTDGFYVQLSWNAASDLDLHLRKDPAPLWDATGDCNWCNTNPSWGGAGGADDPSLDWDAIEGYGPETITIDAPGSGKYRINVHYYGQDAMPECWGACPPSTATVTLYLNGALAKSWTRTLTAAGQVWDVATLDWPSGTITAVDAMTTTSGTECDGW